MRSRVTFFALVLVVAIVGAENPDAAADAPNDDIRDAMERQRKWLSEFQDELEQLARRIDARNELRQRIDEIVRARTLEIQAIREQGTADKSAQLDRAIDDATNRIADNLERGRRASQALDRLTDDWRRLNAEGRALTDRILTTVANALEQQKETADMLREYRSQEHERRCCPCE